MTSWLLPVAFVTSTVPPAPTRTQTRVLTRCPFAQESCGDAGRGPLCGKTVKLLAAVESTLTTLSATSTTPDDGTPPTPSTFTERVSPAASAPPEECVSSTRAGGKAW